eukprot:scaffold148509_cov33-Tisochrysis_lutea.AAC.1
MRVFLCPSMRKSLTVLSKPDVRASCAFGCQSTVETDDELIPAALRSVVRFTESSLAGSEVEAHNMLDDP